MFGKLNAFTSHRLSYLLLFMVASLANGCFTPYRGATTWSDSEGKSINPLRMEQELATVFVFIRTDCPISNRYAPELERLFSTYRSRGIAFWLVYADAVTSSEDIKMHARDYRLTLPSLRDPEHRLVKKAGVKVTPEAAVFLKSGREIYRGR